MFRLKESEPRDQWLVDYGSGAPSRLCLQIGDKGRAVVCHPNYRRSGSASFDKSSGKDYSCAIHHHADEKGNIVVGRVLYYK